MDMDARMRTSSLSYCTYQLAVGNFVTDCESRGGVCEMRVIRVVWIVKRCNVALDDNQITPIEKIVVDLDMPGLDSKNLSPTIGLWGKVNRFI